MTLTLIFIMIMTTWIPTLVYTHYRFNSKFYIFTKSFTSILFLTIGILGHFTGIAPQEYSIYIIIALSFGLIGDVLLVYSDNQLCFVLGLFSFVIGQIVYGLLFLRHNGFSYLDVFIYAAIFSFAIFVYSKSKIEFGVMKLPALLYLCAITFMYTMGLSTLYKGIYSTITKAFIVAGTTLFAASDLVLAFNMFDKSSKPVLKRINMILYFYGQMILAASIITF